MEKRKASISFVTLWWYCVLQSQYCFVKSLKTIKEELIVQLMPLKMLRPLLLYNKEAPIFLLFMSGEFSTKTVCI